MGLKSSQTAAWWAMILVVAVIIVAICTRVVNEFWEYAALFLAFMAVFCHLMSFLLRRMSVAAANKMENIAGILGIFAVIGIIVIFILNFIEFY